MCTPWKTKGVQHTLKRKMQKWSYASVRLLVVNFWTHLDRGRSSPGTHPEPSSLLPPAPSQCYVKCAPDEAAESLRTTAGGGEEKKRDVWRHRLVCELSSLQIKSCATLEIRVVCGIKSNSNWLIHHCAVVESCLINGVSLKVSKMKHSSKMLCVHFWFPFHVYTNRILTQHHFSVFILKDTNYTKVNPTGFFYYCVQVCDIQIEIYRLEFYKLCEFIDI